MRRLLFFSFILIIILAGCINNDGASMNNKMPKDFAFSLIYGTYGKNTVNTFNNTVVKDLVEDGVIEAELILSSAEMNDIYTKMVEMNIMNELNLKDKDETFQCETEPGSTSSWEIKMNDEIKNINYSSNYCEYPDDVLSLYALEDYIHATILKNDAYQQLPDSNGYYE